MLPPLPEAAIETLIDNAAAEPPDERQRRELHQIARGNPLALRELLLGAQPGGLTDLVMARLDSLTQATRRVHRPCALIQQDLRAMDPHLASLVAYASFDLPGRHRRRNPRR